MATTTHLFRAIWPIVDETVPWGQLLEEAKADIPAIALRTRAVLSGRGRFSLASGRDVPGSGGAKTVLVFEGPATPRPPNPATDRLLSKGDNR